MKVVVQSSGSGSSSRGNTTLDVDDVHTKRGLEFLVIRVIYQNLGTVKSSIPVVRVLHGEHTTGRGVLLLSLTQRGPAIKTVIYEGP